METDNQLVIRSETGISYLFRKPKYPLLCKVDGHLIGAKSEVALVTSLAKLKPDESSQNDVVDSTGEGWVLATEYMVLSPMTLKRRWTKLEIVRLYNNRTNESDPDEKPYSEKSLSAKRLDKVLADIVEALDKS